MLRGYLRPRLRIVHSTPDADAVPDEVDDVVTSPASLTGAGSGSVPTVPAPVETPSRSTRLLIAAGIGAAVVEVLHHVVGAL